MKKLKEFKPVLNLLKEDKKKFIFYCILLLLVESTSVFSGYLNGRAVESISKLDIYNSLLYLLIYFVYSVLFTGILMIVSSNGLVKLESKLSRRIGYETYKKTLMLPSYAYEKMSTGEIINRITTDADALSFTFRKLISAFGEIFAAFILLFYIFHGLLELRY